MNQLGIQLAGQCLVRLYLRPREPDRIGELPRLSDQKER